MYLLREALHTYLFLIPLVVLCMTEVTKLFVEWIRTGAWHRRLFTNGGMPSSHSAFVTSLLIIVGRKTGVDSVEFAIAAVFAAVVWYDAVAIRSKLDQQAKVLNLMQKFQELSEQVGHSFLEVIAGMTFGAGVTMLGIWLS